MSNTNSVDGLKLFDVLALGALRCAPRRFRSTINFKSKKGLENCYLNKAVQVLEISINNKKT